MERNLTVTVTEISMAAATETEEECVTPTDPGSRIPPATVCPPAPRKRQPAAFCTEELDEARQPSRKLSCRFSKMAIRLVFDVVDCNATTETEKMTVTENQDQTTPDSSATSDS